MPDFNPFLPFVRPNITGSSLVPRGDGDGARAGLPQAGVLLKSRTKTKKPSLYRVVLMNDDFTPMDFVIQVLEKFFNKTRAEATDIMLHIHRNGIGICGIFTFEVAESKVGQVLDFAREQEQPLQCTMERE
jgi:ATP-dependent Clp protease adaptor protein ClpS